VSCQDCDNYKLMPMYDTDRGICRGWGCLKDLDPETCEEELENEIV